MLHTYTHTHTHTHTHIRGPIQLSWEKTSAVQIQSFAPLIELFDLAHTFSDDDRAVLEDKLDVAPLWETLVDRFLFARATEVKDKARGQAMALLGGIAREFQSKVPRDGQLSVSVVMDQLVTALKGGVERESVSRAVVPGALRGLNGLLDNVGVDGCVCATGNNCVVCTVFKVVMTLLDKHYVAEHKTHETSRRAAALLSRHAWLFRFKMLENYEGVWPHLRALCEHHNTDLRREGFSATDSALREILSDPADTTVDMAMYFLTEFAGILRNPSSRRIGCMALRGVSSPRTIVRACVRVCVCVCVCVCLCV